MLKKSIILFFIIIFTLTACSNESTQNQNFFDANKYLESYQYSLALEQYKLAINKDPKLTEAYLSAADILYLKGLYEEAKEILIAGADNVTTDKDKIYQKLGDCEYKLTNFDKALEYYNKSLNENSGNKIAIKGKINVLAFTEKNDELISFINSFEDSNLDQELFILKAIILYSNPDISIEQLTKAQNGDNQSLKQVAADLQGKITLLKTEENYLSNLTEVVYIALTNKWYEASYPLISKMISLNEYYEMGHLYKGIVLLQNNSLDQALSSFLLSYKYRPDLLSVRLYLIQTYFLQDKKTEAIELVKPSIEFLNSTNINEYKEIIKILFEEKEYNLTQELLSGYQTKIEQQDVDISLYQLKNWFYLGDYLQANNMYDTLSPQIESYLLSQQVEIYTFGGYSKFMNGDKSAGFDIVKKAQLLDQTYPTSYLFEGKILIDQEDFVGAKKSIERAIDLDLSNSEEAQELLKSLE